MVRLSVDDQEFIEELEVRKDPATEGTQADIESQVELLFDIRADLEVVADMINEIESIRRQLYDLVELLGNDEGMLDLRVAATNLGEQFIEVEQKLFQLKVTGEGDGGRWPAQLAVSYTHLTLPTILLV